MWMSYAAMSAAIVLVGGIGGKATDVGPWYRNLVKPSWNPPDWVFPVAWTIIYLFIIAACGGAWNDATAAQKPQLIALIGFNLFVNTLWSILFFSLRKPLWALLDVFLLWISIIAMMVAFAQIHVIHCVLLLPYLLWVSVASVLNMSIVQLNPDLASS